MLPHDHFFVAGFVIAPAALLLYPDKPLSEVAEWVAIGGLASAAIDLDILALVLLRSKKEPRLRQFRNPLMIFRKFRLFMDEITGAGVLATGMKTHLLFSLLLTACAFFALHDFFLPLVLGVLSHILSDLQYVRRLRRRTIKKNGPGA